MSLEEWQVSLISAVVGALIPLVFVAYREWHREEEQKKVIRRALVDELVLIKEAIKEALLKGARPSESEGRPDGRVFVFSDLPCYGSFPLAKDSYYRRIDFQTLAKSLEVSILGSVQKTYQMIDNYNSNNEKRIPEHSRKLVSPSFTIIEGESKELIQYIEKAINEINSRYE